METFTNQEGSRIMDMLIRAIQENKQYLSDIDGAIGDGDHGINMNKGFTLCREALDREPGNLAHSLNILSRILMMKIGGAMGPLYGSFFKAFSLSFEGKENIGRDDFQSALSSSVEALQVISKATVGDKTMMDVLIPAKEAMKSAVMQDLPFDSALDMLEEAARAGRDSTVNMEAKIGRSARLGARSIGVMDAGAASCCLILETMAAGVRELLNSDHKLNK
jgi:phosphoenolpyruvate---glycerone phosphotransferase subunit DhaL